MRQRGHVFIELLVSLIVIGLIGAGLFQFFTSSNLAQEVSTSGNMAITEGRQPIDVVSDHIRNAQQYTSDSGTTYSVIHTAGANAITYYGDEAGATVQYALNNGVLERTDASGTTSVMTNVTALAFKYYLAPSGTTYYSTDLVEAVPSTLAERARIAMVEISGSVSVNGISRSFKSEIRLRNSPRKVRL